HGTLRAEAEAYELDQEDYDRADTRDHSLLDQFFATLIVQLGHRLARLPPVLAPTNRSDKQTCAKGSTAIEEPPTDLLVQVLARLYRMRPELGQVRIFPNSDEASQQLVSWLFSPT